MTSSSMMNEALLLDLGAILLRLLLLSLTVPLLFLRLPLLSETPLPLRVDLVLPHAVGAIAQAASTGDSVAPRGFPPALSLYDVRWRTLPPLAVLGRASSISRRTTRAVMLVRRREGVLWFEEPSLLAHENSAAI